MRYKINIDKTVNDLVPSTLRGRWHVLFIQSIMHPLQILNDKFVKFAKDKHIEARMTSQIMYFEWFLNYKLSHYFVNASDRITIIDRNTLGVPVYHSPNPNTFVVWSRDNEDKAHPVFFHKSDELVIEKYSFIVSCPELKPDLQEECLYMLKYWVDRYKVAGKTYAIKTTNLTQ